MMNVTRNWKVRTLVWACALGWCAGVLGDGAEATEAGGENVRGWTVAEENANAFSFALEADEQGVWLVARPKGTVLLLR